MKQPLVEKYDIADLDVSGYEFTSSLERGRKEIRIEISRYQSEFSTDGWGRRIENPLNEAQNDTTCI